MAKKKEIIIENPKVTITGKMVLQKVTKERIVFWLDGGEQVTDLRGIIIDPDALPQDYDFAKHDLSGTFMLEIEMTEK